VGVVILQATALILAVRAHGEHGAVVRALTPDHGLQAGYVRGGRSRRLKPVLIPGNLVAAEFRARTESQLAALTVELAHSRAPLLAEPLPAAAIDWACALTAAALPEGHPYPRLHEALTGLLDAIEHAPSARFWAAALLRYEQVLLAELGYGLAAAPEALAPALTATGQAIADHVLTGRRGEVMAARARLVERMKRLL
jgi:DNA repair protein RecO (recombination protein O)